MCSCQEVLLRRFQCTFFSCSIFLKAGTVYDRPFQRWTKPSPTEGKPGRMPVPSHLKVFSRSDTDIHPLCGICRSTLSDKSLFLLIQILGDFFSNLPPSLFTSIFTSFSEPHQSVISVLGAKVIPGLDENARSSLLFSAKISSPSGSIFPEKPCIS